MSERMGQWDRSSLRRRRLAGTAPSICHLGLTSSRCRPARLVMSEHLSAIFSVVNLGVTGDDGDSGFDECIVNPICRRRPDR
jgi:hypothetical protein